ncbi:putative ripening-related protein 2 [Glycine max]|nr:putative ripening-related protein 2 [Glycine max]
MKRFISNASFILLATLILSSCSYSEPQKCRPSGRIRGKKAPPGQCNQENDSDCCEEGKMYTTYECSPPMSSHTKAYLTLNSFEKGGDGGGPSECDNQYHSDDTPVVALSTGWFDHKRRCLHNITISGNGRSVVAMVVDQCDSRKGCDADHDYQPPCPNNIVDASMAVWKALGVPKNEWGGCFYSEAQKCHPSGRIRGKKAPPGQCNQENDSDCCKEGKMYTTYECSPPMSSHTKAYLTLNSFEKGGDGGGPSECDNQYHSDDTPVVALSTGWFDHKRRCLHNITISGNGRSVVAMVVDQCDSRKGCDADHDYQPPCPNNIVDASRAVWKALGVPKNDWGGFDITWSDA